MADISRDLQNPEPNSRSANDRTSAIRNFQNKTLSADEVIVWLANTYENKRARQVSEWQRAQLSNVRRIY
jgi:hypothetical protein